MSGTFAPARHCRRCITSLTTDALRLHCSTRLLIRNQVAPEVVARMAGLEPAQSELHSQNQNLASYLLDDIRMLADVRIELTRRQAYEACEQTTSAPIRYKIRCRQDSNLQSLKTNKERDSQRRTEATT